MSILTVKDQCRVVSLLGPATTLCAFAVLAGRLDDHEALERCAPANPALGSQEVCDALPGRTGCIVV